MSDSSNIIQLQGVDVRFGPQAVLRDITLAVPRGQTLAIIGESGCGKTVLLKTIIGLVEPTAGQVLFDGQPMDSFTEQELSRQRTRFGFVFQNAALFDSMTVEQNILFPLVPHEPRSNDKRERMMTLLAEVGLPENALRKRPAELSGGMRKRVGLARALIMRPEVLLYDEPTTGLAQIMSEYESQILYDGPASKIDQSTDRRVTQFVRGEAGERLMELHGG